MHETKTRRATRSGTPAATSATVSPPIEWPTRTNRRPAASAAAIRHREVVDPDRVQLGGRARVRTAPHRLGRQVDRERRAPRCGSGGSQHQAPCAPPCTSTIGSGLTHSLPVLLDPDRLRRAALAGQDDLFLGGGVHVEHDRNPLVVEVEHARRPEPAVARAHARRPVDLDLEGHRSVFLLILGDDAIREGVDGAPAWRRHRLRRPGTGRRTCGR